MNVKHEIPSGFKLDRLDVYSGQGNCRGSQVALFHQQNAHDLANQHQNAGPNPGRGQ